MTVEEVLALPNLSRLKILAGKTGIHRRVSSVTVVDTPDGATWIKGNEFVITTAFAVKDDASQITALVRQLAASDASALGIKTERFIKNIPAEALAAADELNFPLITIPDEYAFRDIINPVLSLVVNRQSQLLLQADKIHHDFMEMAVNNNSVPEILSTLKALLNQSTMFIDIHFKQFYYSDYDNGMTRQFTGLSVDEFKPDLFPQYRCHVVANKSQKFGYLLTENENTGDMDKNIIQTAIDYASVVLILRTQTRISTRHIEEKYRDAFIEDILTNNVKTENEIHNRARLYGWDFSSGGMAIVIDINNIKKYYIKSLDPKTNERLKEITARIFDASIYHMLNIFPEAKYYKQSDLIVFIVSQENYDEGLMHRQLERTFNTIRDRIADTVSFTITMGVGDYERNIKEIHKSYSQARTAINLGYQLEMFDCILFYKKMDIYRLLATTINTDEFKSFQSRYITPLLEYDNKCHASLMTTLQAVIKSGWNLKSASEALFVHYNSVKYRFTKISEVLGVDLRSHEERLAVEIALKMHMISNHQWM
ncbi:MAG: PucR family transcriptional regulator ligand-binding domain-containing protein [Cloacibacillus sp.]